MVVSSIGDPGNFTLNRNTMARFILDVANCDKKEASKIMDRVVEELGDKVASITLVDVSNDNQFYEDASKNVLSEKQINNFKLRKS